MNKKTIYALVGVVSILTVTRVDAATIFAPTDGDVNFLFSDLTGGTLAMFDDSDQGYSGASITIPLPSIIGIVGPVIGGDHIATNSLSETLTLTGNSNFILGFSTDGGMNWLADSLVISAGANSYIVSFGDLGSVLQVDVEIMPAIPLPAAIWLFGSGLLGLVGSAIRRKALPG